MLANFKLDRGKFCEDVVGRNENCPPRRVITVRSICPSVSCKKPELPPNCGLVVIKKRGTSRKTKRYQKLLNHANGILVHKISREGMISTTPLKSHFMQQPQHTLQLDDNGTGALRQPTLEPDVVSRLEAQLNAARTTATPKYESIAGKFSGVNPITIKRIKSKIGNEQCLDNNLHQIMLDSIEDNLEVSESNIMKRIQKTSYKEYNILCYNNNVSYTIRSTDFCKAEKGNTVCLSFN
uniref:Ground-like domain-containing protein n=1 Tax=Rhabditophanes sp. KR3021 TaxID=114890 RepID=A0AC35TJN3_9BILA